MSIAKNIRYLRHKKGWGQDLLAEKLGYKSYTTVQKWESGVSEPPLKTVHALSDLFNVDIDDLASTDLESYDTIQLDKPDGLDELDRALLSLLKQLSKEQKQLLFAQLQVLTDGR